MSQLPYTEDQMYKVHGWTIYTYWVYRMRGQWVDEKLTPDETCSRIKNGFQALTETQKKELKKELDALKKEAMHIAPEKEAMPEYYMVLGGPLGNVFIGYVSAKEDESFYTRENIVQMIIQTPEPPFAVIEKLEFSYEQ